MTMKATEKEKVGFKEYAQKNKAKIQEYRRQYYQANREKLRKQQKERYNLVKDNPGWKLKEYKRRKQWWEGNKELHRAIARASWHKLKEEVLAHYSDGEMRCLGCGFSDIRALSIDHIKGGGAKHRREIRNFYSWLKKSNYPKGFQVLCMNCQFIKRAEKGECTGAQKLIKAIGEKE